MSFVEQEIESQPAVWRRAAALARERTEVLPAPGARVAFLGCGTSFYVAQALACAREAAGQGESDAFAASEMPLGRRYDLAVALSRSGTTTEVLQLVERLRASTPVLAITADAESPLARRAARTLPVPFADERSVVQTRFATCTLALLLTHLGHTLEAAARDAERVLHEPQPVDPERPRQLVFLGRSWSVGLAQEAALKVREAAQAWSEAYPAMEYRHGPISTAAPGTVVWSLDQMPPGLADQITETGAQLVAASADPLVELVRAQRLAVAMAKSRGLDPDRPRNLTRSVVLEGDGEAA
jgi:fructoselysine-6-P-deglycase FrlB-like protein